MTGPRMWRRSITLLVSVWLSTATLLGCATEPESGAFDVESEGHQVALSTTTSVAREPEVSRCGQLTLATTLFETGSALLPPGAETELLETLDRQLAGSCVGDGELACSNGDVSADVVGHTDSEPHSAPGGNQELSEQRAQAIADLLAQRGIDSTVSGVADRELISDTDPQQNRRVVVTFTCQARHSMPS